MKKLGCVTCSECKNEDENYYLKKRNQLKY